MIRVFVPYQIASIYFDGARTLEDHAAPRRKKSLAREIYEAFVPPAPEDPASIASAENYLSRLGYNRVQIGIFRSLVKSGVETYLQRRQDINGEGPAALEYDDRFYLGVKANGQSLHGNRDGVAEMRNHFITGLNKAKKTTAGLLYAADEKPRRGETGVAPATP